MATRIQRFASVLMGTILLAGAAAALAAVEPAGRVIYAYGQVQATDQNGRRRALRKGDEVFQGDTLQTLNGRTQVRFRDGGFAALQPRTQYRIEDYKFKGVSDGSERSFFNLLRGGVRLVTGAIGRVNNKSYRVRTAVATIGIRGSSANLLSCVAGSCAELQLEDGTYLTNWDGLWTLASGPFDGVVRPFETYYCSSDSTGCSKLEAPPGERRRIYNVGKASAEEDEDCSDQGLCPPIAVEAADPFQGGEQRDEAGILCDVGGACGLGGVIEDQVGASAWAIPSEDTDQLEDLTVFLGSPPVGGLELGTENGLPDFSFAIVDLDKVQSQIADITDPETREIAEMLLEAADPEAVAFLRENPARIGEFATTSDGLLTYGSWIDGRILDIEYFDGELDTFVDDLSGFQQLAFIYGPPPGALPSAGVGTFTFTGGSLSASASGATGGQGVTGGTMIWDFGLGTGSLDMDLIHDSKNFDVMGSLKLDSGDPGFFVEDVVTALSSGGSYDVIIDGFFSGVADGAPAAAGFGYEILASDIIRGVAGFGLTGFDTAPPPPSVEPIPTGQVVLLAANFADSSFTANSFADGMMVDGTPDNSGTLTDGSITQLTWFTAFPCEPCDFDAGSASLADSGSVDSTLDAGWDRWKGDYALSDAFGNFQNLQPADAHFLRFVPTPPTELANATASSSVPYNQIVGGTAPTLLIGSDGTLEEGTYNNLLIEVDFVVQDITRTEIGADFPGSGISFTLINPVASPISNGFFSASDGGSQTVQFSGGPCGSPCSAFATGSIYPIGNTVNLVEFGGTAPPGFGIAFQANTGATPELSVAGTGVVTPP